MNQRRRFGVFFAPYTHSPFTNVVFSPQRDVFKAPTSSDPLRSLRLPWKRTIGKQGKLSKSGFVELEIMFSLAAGGAELQQ